MLSQSAEYVLRVVVFLAAQEGKATTTREIATATHVPEGYLSKLLQSLGRANLVHSQRGLHGGFVLTRAPEEITVLDVILAVDMPQRIKGCPLGIESHNEELCPLHRRLDEAMAQIEEAFRRTTIGDVVRDQSRTRPLCGLVSKPKRKSKPVPAA